MLINKMLIAVALITLGSSSCLAGTAIDLNHVAVIEGEIAGRSLVPVENYIDQQFAAGERSVDLIINSPGGSVISGFLFINKMNQWQEQGMRIRCFVPQVSASMAFQITLHCSERHVLERAFLLWHRVRVQLGGGLGGSETMTAPQAEYLATTLQREDDLIFDELREYMPEVSEKVLRYHFENETLHVGLHLHELAPHTFTSHKYIPGLYESLKNPKVVHSIQGGLFGLLGEEIRYESDLPQIQMFFQ